MRQHQKNEISQCTYHTDTGEVNIHIYIQICMRTYVSFVSFCNASKILYKNAITAAAYTVYNVM